MDVREEDDDGALGGCRRMSYKRALVFLMKEIETTGTTRDREAGLVRHGDAATTSLWRSSVREYAAEGTESRLSVAQAKVQNLRKRLEDARRKLRVARWRYAISTFTRCFLRPTGGLEEASRAKKRAKTAWHRLFLQIKHEIPEEIESTNVDLAKVVPYLQLLSAANRSGLEAADAAVEQSGFQTLVEFKSTGAVSTACPICLVEPPVRPVFTPCLHVMCHECARKLLAAAEIMESGRVGKCPLCRKEINGFENMIEIVHEDEDELEGGGDDDGAEEYMRAPAAPSAPPGYPPPASDVDLQKKKFWDPEPPRMPPRGDLIALRPRFLSHFAQCRKQFNPKLRKMLQIVCESESKVVVFSQLAEGVKSAFEVLRSADVGVLMLSANDKEANQLAIERFRIEEEIRALVLCVGSEGSGLTLTMSSRIVFLEPCLSASAEAQCISRCVRLGQRAAEVFVHVLYRERTLEERLLWCRQQELDGGTPLGVKDAADGARDENDTGSYGDEVEHLRDALGMRHGVHV